MDKCKILIVAGAMDVGGIENQLMHLLRRCSKQKFQIDFTSTDPNAHYLPEIRALSSSNVDIFKSKGSAVVRKIYGPLRVSSNLHIGQSKRFAGTDKTNKAVSGALLQNILAAL